MRIIKQRFEFKNPSMFTPDYRTVNGREVSSEGIEALRLIEDVGRTCYKSHKDSTIDEAAKLVLGWIKSGHHSVIEHVNISVLAVTDRGVTHEIVRHRLAAYSQESTRYCNYSKEKFGKEITVILPIEFYDVHEEWLALVHSNDIEEWANSSKERSAYSYWANCLWDIEEKYLNMIDDCNASAQLARSVLPNSLKTEIFITYNIREWRHFFKLRCSLKAHPQMRNLALSMLREFYLRYPVFFDDLHAEYLEA